MRFKLLAALPCLLSWLLSAAQPANRFDVLITELMPDPLPVIGLPAAEYIEIKNVSNTVINLNGWRLSDNKSTATITRTFLLQPDSFLIICAAANAPFFEPFGTTIGVTNFPSLNNEADTISIISPQGKTIHAVNYNEGWYGNPLKSDGGWSLEMIDTRNPCTGSNNWKASNNANGGTPGKTNSVNGVSKDEEGPTLKHAFAADSVTLFLMFDEPLDSSLAAMASNYATNYDAVITKAEVVAPLFNTVQLALSKPLKKGTIYTITVTGITDCLGNPIGAINNVKTGMPEDAQRGDLVINEILFNPKTGNHDYVEVYNRSTKIINAGSVFIANRNSAGSISNAKKLSLAPFYIFPGDYVVITEDAIQLEQSYFVKNKAAVITIASLPAFPDDEGTVVLTNIQLTVIDEVRYKDDWHFALLANAEGVALERIDPALPSQDANNWHSAASTAGYGTPGYQNSQYKQASNSVGTITITPKTFSPDNDGFNDIVTINYSVLESGYVANIIIFDAAGREVRHLVNNDLLGLKGFWTWDGLGEKRRRLPIGTYIIYTELFNLKGKKQRFKNAVVLSGRL